MVPQTTMLKLTLLLFTSSAVHATSRCYYPDGSLDTLSFVCNTTAVANGDTSTCCRAGDDCYDSGTCFQGWTGISYRQSCTDATWKSPTCPQYCLGSGQLSDGVWIQSCDLTKSSACCLGSVSCCDNLTEVFKFAPGVLLAVLGNPDGLKRLVDASTSTAASTSGVTSSTRSLDSSATSSVSTTGTTSATTQNSSSEASDTSSATNTGSQNNIVAIITGTILGAAFALASAGMLYFRKKYHSERQYAQSLYTTPAPQTVLYRGPPGTGSDEPKPQQLDSTEPRQFAELQGSNLHHELYNSTGKGWGTY